MVPLIVRRLTPLFILLFALPVIAFQPALVHSGDRLSSLPHALTATVELGSSADLSLILQNDTAAPIAPRLFTGYGPASVTPEAGPDRVPLPQSSLHGTLRLDPQIAPMQQASADGRAEVLVVLADQADLSPAYAIRDWAARGSFVYQTLTRHAQATQAPVRDLLDARGVPYTPLWIVNGMVVEADAADLQALAQVGSVAALRLTQVASLQADPPVLPNQVASSCISPDDLHCWNLTALGVDRAWHDFGVYGAGITVANLDSGVQFEHPALFAQYRGNQPTGLSHAYHWYDSFGGQPAPVDSGNHGTHTMGTMVARSLPAVGIAPEAQWIAARACSVRECSELNLIRAAQWLLAPTDADGLNPRPELRPHIINNSWTAGQNAQWYLGYVVAWRAAGIYPVFAGGNTGNLAACGTIQSPGDYAEVTAVGATDSGNRLTSFSSIGPGPEGRIKPDLIAPGNWVVSTVASAAGFAPNSGTSMAAPHVAGAVALLWSANPALIGDYAATYAALATSAQPISVEPRFQTPEFAACRPDQIPNNLFGYGLLDVYAALAQVEVRVPWIQFDQVGLATLAPGSQTAIPVRLDSRYVPGPGTYTAQILVHGADLGQAPLVVPVRFTVLPSLDQATLFGQVTRQADGSPLVATVHVPPGLRLTTDLDGSFKVTLPAHALPVTLTITARDHLTKTLVPSLHPASQTSLTIPLAEDRAVPVADAQAQAVALRIGEQTALDFGLSNLGTRPLSYTVSVAAESFGVWRSDEPDGPASAWLDPPPTAQTLNLSDDAVSEALELGFSMPYFGRDYPRIWVGANGLIGFVPLITPSQGFVRGCLPLAESFGPGLAVLRADLDPTRPGARVSFAELPEGALITWEQLGLASDPTASVSFQALLQLDGRIRFAYRDVAALPLQAGASVGLQRDQRELQILGCGAQLGLHDGLTVELRPQPVTSLWLSVEPASASVAPGARTVVQATARWLDPPTSAWPLSGAILVRSNDWSQTTLRLTVRLTAEPAPYQVYLPFIQP